MGNDNVVLQIIRTCVTIGARLLDGQPIKEQMNWLNIQYAKYKENGGK